MRSFFFSLTTAVALMVSNSADAATFVLDVSADALAKDFNEPTSFQEVDFTGIATNNRQVGNVPAGPGGTIPDSISRSVFEFDLSSVTSPGGSLSAPGLPVTGELSLNGFSYGASTKTVEVYAYYGNGSIENSDFFFAGGPVATFDVGSGLVYSPGISLDGTGTPFSTTLNVDSAISDFLTNGASYAGFLFVLSDESAQYQWVDIIGTNYPGGSSPPATELFPKLTIETPTPVPIPASLPLLLGTIVAFGVLRRSKNKPSC